MTLSSTTDSRWFLQFQGQVKGPFDSESLQTTLNKIGEAHLNETLIWKRGLTEWLKASKWNPEQDSKPVFIPTPIQNTIGAETTLAATLTENAFYKVQVNFKDQPLMTKSELQTLLSKQQDVSVVSIQDPITKDWKDVYAFPDIIEKLGLTRRTHQRVPILAQFSGVYRLNQSLNARVITISEGGLGLTDQFEIKISDTIEGQITSPHFFQPVSIKAEVIYAGLDGYVGLKFTQITDEAKSAIIDYIKKFGKKS